MNQVIDEMGTVIATVKLPLCLLAKGNILQMGKWLVRIQFIKVTFAPSQGGYDEIIERQIHVEVL